MKMKENYPIFIPILEIPGLMIDNSKFYKEYSYYVVNNRPPFNSESPIEGNGYALIKIAVGPEVKKLKKLHENSKQIDYRFMTAMIDTGANISAIRRSKAKELKLRSYKGGIVTGMNRKPKQMRNVDLSIHLTDIFPNHGFLDVSPITANFHEEAPFDFIIGWDILRYCTLQYNYPKSQFYLEFKGAYQKDEI